MSPFVAILLCGIGLVLIFTAGRELTCWFYKINTIVKSLDDIAQKLNSINGNLSATENAKIDDSKRISNNEESSKSDTVQSSLTASATRSEKKPETQTFIKAPTPTITQGSRCPKCGTTNSSSQFFCTQCGAKL